MPTSRNDRTDEIIKRIVGDAESLGERTARGTLETAKALSPVLSGANRDSGRVEEIAPNVWEVSFNMPYSVILEFGSVFRAGSHYLTAASELQKYSARQEFRTIGRGR